MKKTIVLCLFVTLAIFGCGGGSSNIPQQLPFNNYSAGRFLGYSSGKLVGEFVGTRQISDTFYCELFTTNGNFITINFINSMYGDKLYYKFIFRNNDVRQGIWYINNPLNESTVQLKVQR